MVPVTHLLVAGRYISSETPNRDKIRNNCELRHAETGAYNVTGNVAAQKRSTKQKVKGLLPSQRSKVCCQAKGQRFCCQANGQRSVAKPKVKGLLQNWPG